MLGTIADASQVSTSVGEDRRWGGKRLEAETVKKEEAAGWAVWATTLQQCSTITNMFTRNYTSLGRGEVPLSNPFTRPWVR